MDTRSPLLLNQGSPSSSWQRRQQQQQQQPSAESSIRSISWLVNLGILVRGQDVSQWQVTLKECRAEYRRFKTVTLRAPDGSLFYLDNDPHAVRTTEQAVAVHGQSVSSSASLSLKSTQVNVNNPLSLADENPWHAHYAKLGTFEQIQKDVERIFPDDDDQGERFAVALSTLKNRSHFATQLSAVLAVWSLHEKNSEIGYRQGMHELAAICWLVAQEDVHAHRTDRNGTLLLDDNDDDLVEAHAFTLFNSLMVRMAPLYAWKQQPGGSGGQSVLPIHLHCELIRESLRANDAQLARHLGTLAVDIPIFAIRWLRLMFLREAKDVTMAIAVWDALLDTDPSLHLMDHVCVALLMRRRTDLLQSDYAGVLQVLLGGSQKEALITTSMQGQQNEDEQDELMSAQRLMNEARHVHRRYMAVRRSGVEGADDDRCATTMATWPQRRRDDVSQFSGETLFGAGYYNASSAISDITKGVNAQTLGAGLQRALNNVQKTVSDAYQQAQAAASAASVRRNASEDGFPPLIDDVSRSMKSTQYASGIGTGSTPSTSGIGSGLTRVPFSFGSSLSSSQQGSVKHSSNKNAQFSSVQHSNNNKTHFHPDKGTVAAASDVVVPEQDPLGVNRL